GIEHDQAVAVLREPAVRAQQRLGSRLLEERPRLPVEGEAQEVVRRRVADVEAERRVQRGEVDELGLAERAGLGRRTLGERDAVQQVQGIAPYETLGIIRQVATGVERRAVLRADGAPLEPDAAELHGARAAVLAPREDQPLA